jgi:hypothetical protein
VLQNSQETHTHLLMQLDHSIMQVDNEVIVLSQSLCEVIIVQYEG